MNHLESLYKNNQNENIYNKLESKDDSLKLKKKCVSSFNFQSQSNNEFEKCDLKINFKLLDNFLHEYKEKNNPKKYEFIENNFFTKNNNNEYVIKNKEFPLKIQIPFDILDNHPIFIVEKINDKNNNCNIII